MKNVAGVGDQTKKITCQFSVPGGEHADYSLGKGDSVFFERWSMPYTNNYLLSSGMISWQQMKKQK